mgnify:CR=1 FL=1
MKVTLHRGISMLAIGLLAGCASMFPKTDVNAVSYGPRPTKEEATIVVRTYLKNTLIDPDSLILDCSEVSNKGWARDNPFKQPTYRYLDFCNVNAKNRLGKKKKKKPYVFTFNGPKRFGVFSEANDGEGSGVGYGKTFGYLR